jgi:hypothetical protein
MPAFAGMSGMVLFIAARPRESGDPVLKAKYRRKDHATQDSSSQSVRASRADSIS